MLVSQATWERPITLARLVEAVNPTVLAHLVVGRSARPQLGLCALRGMHISCCCWEWSEYVNRDTVSQATWGLHLATPLVQIPAAPNYAIGFLSANWAVQYRVTGRKSHAEPESVPCVQLKYVGLMAPGPSRCLPRQSVSLQTRK